MILDGHKTHAVEDNIELCRQSNITLCFLPAHTSHVIQPLDVGIFNSYKANYRKAVKHPAVVELKFDAESNATQARCKMLARGIIAHMQATTMVNVKRAFEVTGIYPLKVENFLVNCNGIPNLGSQTYNMAKRKLQQEENALKVRIAERGRVNVYDNLYVVNFYA